MCGFFPLVSGCSREGVAKRVLFLAHIFLGLRLGETGFSQSFPWSVPQLEDFAALSKYMGVSKQTRGTHVMLFLTSPSQPALFSPPFRGSLCFFAVLYLRFSV